MSKAGAKCRADVGCAVKFVIRDSHCLEGMGSMAKYFGLLLLLTSWFMAGCGPKAATEEQAKRGMG